MNKELLAAHARARGAFLKFSTVLGVGIGAKVDGGKVTAREAIVVLVAKKLPPKNVPEGELIPKHFAVIPTDVREPVLQIAPKARQAEPGSACRRMQAAPSACGFRATPRSSSVDRAMRFAITCRAGCAPFGCRACRCSR